MTLTLTLTKRSWLIDISFLIILLAIFYLLWLGSYPLFTPDEGRYSEVAREMVASGDYITPRIDGVAFLDKPALYYWLQAIAIHLFGLKEWALRLFPAMLGMLGCLSTYICGRLLFNRRAALLSAGILATAPLYFGAAHYANLDLEVAVLISCSLQFLITSIKINTTYKNYFLYGAYTSAGLAILTKGLIGIVFPIAILGSWIILLWRWDILKKIHLFSGLFLLLTITLPWYILVQKANPYFLQFFFGEQQFGRFLSNAEFNNKAPFWFYFPIVLAGLFPWSIFLYQTLVNNIKKVWSSRHEYQTQLFLLLWVAFTFTFFSLPKSKTVGYILPIFPALALLIGNFLDLQWGKVKAQSIRWGLLIFIGLCSIISLILFSLPFIHQFVILTKFNHTLFIIAWAFFTIALLACFLLKTKNLFPIFIFFAAGNILLLLTLTIKAAELNQNSIKPIANKLKMIIHPEDEIITFYNYYQDLPLYLERRVSIVENWTSKKITKKDNWARELWYGMRFQATDDWLINDKKFWQRWNDSSHGVFLLTNKNRLALLDTLTVPSNHYTVIAEDRNIVLLRNSTKNP